MYSESTLKALPYYLFAFQLYCKLTCCSRSFRRQCNWINLHKSFNVLNIEIISKYCGKKKTCVTFKAKQLSFFDIKNNFTRIKI